jgi:hypothetical protein
MLQFKHFLIPFLLFIHFVASAQLPAFGPAYLQNEVATIRISIHPDSLSALFAAAGTEREFPANFKYESSVLTDSVAAIGFRLRGNTSLNAEKQSFKISFNTFNSSTWQGIQKMNLNGSANDPSMIRSKICWDVLRDANLPAARSSFVKLYINSEYRGLYSNIEHIDEIFANLYFPGCKYSSQFKCLYPAPLDYISSNPTSYNYVEFGRRPYDQKTNDYTQDYRELSTFISILNQTPIADLPCALERKFDVDSWLRYAALDVLMGNWDGYIYNKNNYYLQLDYHTGQFHYLPYDLDNTLGIDWVGQNWTTRNVMSWAPSSESRPLFKRLLQVPDYSARYQNYIREYAQGIFSPTVIAQKAANMIALIAPAVANDTYHTLDFGFTYDDFLNSATSAWGNHVNFSINNYVSQRTSTTLAQTSSSAQSPILTGGFISDDNQLAFARINGSGTGNLQVLISSTNTFNTAEYTFTLFDNGVIPDTLANDGNYAGVLNYPNSLSIPQVYYRFEYTPSGSSTIQKWPCNSRVLYMQPQGVGLLNEIMSSNNSTVVDLANDYSDWVELYNPLNTSISMDNVYLSDNPSYLNKWPFPSISIPAQSFKMLWANDDEEFSRNNLNFKLSAIGESLILSKKIDDAYQTIENIEIPPLPSDFSYGKSSDGGSNWIVFNPAQTSPNASNSSVGIEEINSPKIQLYPNPANEFVRFSKHVDFVQLFDAQGRLVLSQTQVNEINLQHLFPGIYHINLDSQKFRLLIQ